MQAEAFDQVLFRTKVCPAELSTFCFESTVFGLKVGSRSEFVLPE